MGEPNRCPLENKPRDELEQRRHLRIATCAAGSRVLPERAPPKRKGGRGGQPHHRTPAALTKRGFAIWQRESTPSPSMLQGLEKLSNAATVHYDSSGQCQNHVVRSRAAVVQFGAPKQTRVREGQTTPPSPLRGQLNGEYSAIHKSEREKHPEEQINRREKRRTEGENERSKSEFDFCLKWKEAARNLAAEK